MPAGPPPTTWGIAGSTVSRQRLSRNRNRAPGNGIVLRRVRPHPLVTCSSEGPMDVSAAHLHLVLNHIPVLGTMLFAPLVLLWGLLRQSRDVTQIALLLTVLLAVTAIPIYLTGEPAEEQLEHQPWFDKQRVEAHEERAEAALIAVLVTGV